MKKIILCIALATVSMGMFAQQRTNEDLRRWSLGLKGGMDFYRVSPEGDNNLSWTAPSLFVEYSITPLFGMGIDAGYFNFDRKVGRLGTFNGNTIDATLYGSLNFSNLVSPMRTGFWSKVNLYVNTGFGVGFYNYDLQYNIRETDVKGDGVSGVATIGFNLAFDLGRAWELGLESQYRYYTSNNIGGYANNDLGSDALVLSLGVRYKFGAGKHQHVRNTSVREYFPMANTTNINVDTETLRRLKYLEDETLRNQIRNLENQLRDLENKNEGTVTAAFHNIEFRFDSADLTQSDKQILDQIARVLKNNTSWSSLRVIGNTDNIGTKEVNQAMSEKRANAVKNYLVSSGIAASKITTVGNGQSKPIATNDTEQGRQQNRRVEFEIKR